MAGSAIARWIACLAALCAPAVFAAAGSDPEIREQFKNPPAQFRPLTITHSRPLTDPATLDWLAQRRAGGAVLDAGVKPGSKDLGQERWNNPTYLNDPGMLERFRETVKAMRARDMRVWVYDELGYPSGSAGGRVLEGHPEFQVTAVGCRTFSPAPDGTVEVQVTHPDVEACYAMPQRDGSLLLDEARDLTTRARQGSFPWRAPSAQWVVCLLERYQPDTWRRHNIPRRNVNILDRNAVRRFIGITHERYAETLGPAMRDVDAFFTDEPQFGAAEHWGGGLPDAAPAVQWCDELPVAFRRKHGYDIRAALPALFHPAGPKTPKYRHDFYDVQSDLAAENYFGQIEDWCHRHGVLSSGHLLLEESLLFHVMFSGSLIKNMARMDIPGVDLIGTKLVSRRTMSGWGVESVEDFSCKLASSVAHLLRKPGVFTESFALARQAGVRQVLGVTAWQFSGGITHMSTYTVQDTLPAADYAAFCDFAARLAVFCRRGAPVAQVAVLVPELSVWAVYNPPDGGRFRRYIERNPEALKIDDVFRQTSHAMLKNQRQFEFVSDDLLQRATIGKGRLLLGDESFAFLVLPEVRMMRKSSFEKIRAFLKAGGHVAIVGSLPVQTPGAGEDRAITRAVQALMGAYPDRVMHVETTAGLQSMVQWMDRRDKPFLRWDGSPEVRILQRREPAREILLLANPSRLAIEGRVALPAAGTVVVWDPETGGAETAGRGEQGGPISVRIPGESARLLTIER